MAEVAEAQRSLREIADQDMARLKRALWPPSPKDGEQRGAVDRRILPCVPMTDPSPPAADALVARQGEPDALAVPPALSWPADAPRLVGRATCRPIPQYATITDEDLA